LLFAHLCESPETADRHAGSEAKAVNELITNVDKERKTEMKKLIRIEQPKKATRLNKAKNPSSAQRFKI